MKHTIYALVDPNTHQVRYVGRTAQPPTLRFQNHVRAACQILMDFLDSMAAVGIGILP